MIGQRLHPEHLGGDQPELGVREVVEAELDREPLAVDPHEPVHRGVCPGLLEARELLLDGVLRGGQGRRVGDREERREPEVVADDLRHAPREVPLVRRRREPGELGDRDAELLRPALGHVEEDLHPLGVRDGAGAASRARPKRRQQEQRAAQPPGFSSSAPVEPGIEPEVHLQVLSRELPGQRRKRAGLDDGPQRGLVVELVARALLDLRLAAKLARPGRSRSRPPPRPARTATSGGRRHRSRYLRVQLAEVVGEREVAGVDRDVAPGRRTARWAGRAASAPRRPAAAAGAAAGRPGPSGPAARWAAPRSAGARAAAAGRPGPWAPRPAGSRAAAAAGSARPPGEPAAAGRGSPSRRAGAGRAPRARASSAGPAATSGARGGGGSTTRSGGVRTAPAGAARGAPPSAAPSPRPWARAGWVAATRAPARPAPADRPRGSRATGVAGTRLTM